MKCIFSDSFTHDVDNGATTAHSILLAKHTGAGEKKEKNQEWTTPRCSCLFDYMLLFLWMSRHLELAYLICAPCDCGQRFNEPDTVEIDSWQTKSWGGKKHTQYSECNAHAKIVARQRDRKMPKIHAVSWEFIAAFLTVHTLRKHNISEVHTPRNHKYSNVLPHPYWFEERMNIFFLFSKVRRGNGGSGMLQRGNTSLWRLQIFLKWHFFHCYSRRGMSSRIPESVPVRAYIPHAIKPFTVFVHYYGHLHCEF